MASPLRGVRSSQVVDGLGDLAVDLDIGAAHSEAFGVWALYADAENGGDPRARVGAVHRDVQGDIEAHVEAQYATGAH